MWLRVAVAKWLLTALACVSLPAVCSAAPVESPTKAENTDMVCQQLYSDYIVRSGKYDLDVMNAVVELINVRGRTSGFWKTVVQGLNDTKNEQAASRHVQVLARMLREDGYGRWIATLPDRDKMMWAPGIYLPKEVTLKLIETGSKSESILRDWCVVALAGAKDPVAHDFLAKTLAAEEPRGMSAKFHASVGLVNLGDKDGIEWLIAHCSDDADNVAIAWSTQTTSRALGPNCISVLKEITGRSDWNRKSEFQEWWTNSKEKWTAGRPVALKYTY